MVLQCSEFRAVDSAVLVEAQYWLSRIASQTAHMRLLHKRNCVMQLTLFLSCPAPAAAAYVMLCCCVQWVMVLNDDPSSQAEHWQDAFDTLIENAAKGTL